MEKLIYEAKPYFLSGVSLTLLHGSSGAQLLLRSSCLLLLLISAVIIYFRWQHRSEH